jgi:hypothetical protein
VNFKLLLTSLAAVLVTAGTTSGAVSYARTVDVSAINQEIGTMLAAKTSVTTVEQRQQLASDIMRQVENPFSINQGQHNTCAFAATEARTYTVNPRAAVELIRQVATTGMYVTAHGEKIKIDKSNLAPDNEAVSGGSGARSYASQLFQITAANIYWQRQKQDPRGIQCGQGAIHYIQKRPELVIPNDTGERLQIFWQDDTVETVVSDSGRPICEPCVSIAQVQEIGTLIAQGPGKQLGKQFVLADRKFDRSRKYIGVKSMEDLRKQLIECQQTNRMPLVAAVDISHGLFEAPSNTTQIHDFKPQWHAVCITTYDAQHDTVSVDNFWGAESDRIGANSIALPELYSVITSTKRGT